ncbi:MAG: DnaJ family domain-containing protein [Deltaproteobacteria bacterium]
MADDKLEEEIYRKLQHARKLARYMSSTEDLVEQQILKAQEKGGFDNLDGAGKPVEFEENPYEPPELRMVYKILKDNDFAPYWVELGKEIDHQWKRFWDDVEYFRKYSAMIYRDKRSRQSIERFEKKKAHFYYEQRLVLETINKKIIDYNLHCPTFQQGRANFIVDDQMYIVISGIEKAIEEALTEREKG